MRENISSLSQREDYTPTAWDSFLWWLSTAEKELLAECVVDRNRYRIIGTTVLGTWAFATLAWTYFWSTISSNWIACIALGLFMGFIILTIDRALIKGINKFNKKKAAPLLLRSLLAITLGTFMAQPAVLYMFDREIKMQASLDNEKRKRDKQQQVDSLFSQQKKTLEAEKAYYDNQLTTKYNEVSAARQAFVQEIDGTGGSGKIGISTIAKAKRLEYEKLDEEYKKLEGDLRQKKASTDSSLNALNASIKKENETFAGLLNNGFLTRIEALNNLVKSNGALQWRYILIVIILMLIELMPVLAKSMLPSGTYDDKVKLREDMEREIAASNQLKEKELKELYNQLAKENDETFLKHFFEQTREESNQQKKERLKKRNGLNDSFDGFWDDVKRNILTKQEQ